jgi:hypothetical protein
LKLKPLPQLLAKQETDLAALAAARRPTGGEKIEPGGLKMSEKQNPSQDPSPSQDPMAEQPKEKAPEKRKTIIERIKERKKERISIAPNQSPERPKGVDI